MTWNLLCAASRPAPTVPNVDPGGSTAVGSEVFAPPRGLHPEPQVAATGGLERQPAVHAKPQRMPIGGVGQEAVLENQHPVLGRFTAGPVLPLGGGLVERNAQAPRKVVPVGERLIVERQPRPPADEVGIEIYNLAVLSIGRLCVERRERCGRAEEVLFLDAQLPRDAPGRRGKIQLRLGAPSVLGADPQREAALDPHRVHPHLSEHVETPERALAFHGARRVVLLPLVDQERATDNRRVGLDVKGVGSPREIWQLREILFIEDVLIDDYDRVDDRRRPLGRQPSRHGGRKQPHG